MPCHIKEIHYSKFKKDRKSIYEPTINDGMSLSEKEIFKTIAKINYRETQFFENKDYREKLLFKINFKF